MKKIEDGIMFATHPLDDGHWMEFPLNVLNVFRDGKLVYEGRRHEHTYTYDPEKIKAIYMAYATL